MGKILRPIRLVFGSAMAAATCKPSVQSAKIHLAIKNQKQQQKESTMIKEENGALVLDELNRTGNVFMAAKGEDPNRQKQALIQAWITYAIMMGYKLEDIEFNQ